MSTDIYDLDFYKIPSNTIIQNRKEFYGLRRESGEQIKSWLNRVRSYINRCEFPIFVEYLLIDKFVCELNSDEKRFICTALDIWTVKRLNKYLRDQTGETEHMDVNDVKYIDPSQELLSLHMEKFKRPVHTLILLFILLFISTFISFSFNFFKDANNFPHDIPNSEMADDEDILDQLKSYKIDKKALSATTNTQIDIRNENLYQAAKEDTRLNDDVPNSVMKCEFVCVLRERFYIFGDILINVRYILFVFSGRL